MRNRHSKDPRAVDRPRICLLTETYYPVVGGGETQAKTLAEGLADHGFNVVVVTRRSDAALAPRETYGDILVHRIAPIGPQHFLKWGLLVTGLVKILTLRHQYDLVFVSGFRILGVPALLAARLLGKTCILKADSLGEMSGDFFSAGLSRLRLKPLMPVFRLLLGLRNTLLRRADTFVAISTTVAEELVEWGVPAARIRQIPNSVDTNRFHPVGETTKLALRRRLGLPLQGSIVIYTGRLVAYKGLPLLLQAWRKVQAAHNCARLVLVGAGGLDIHNCEEELKAYVQAHHLETSVAFTGNVTNVHEYLQAADIFALPTENEAFGISLIEAMACGLAVIGTDAGGMKDILHHQSNGLVIEAGSFHQLVDALETLLINPKVAGQLGKMARQQVEDAYSSDSVNRRYMDLFEGEIGRS